MEDLGDALGPTGFEKPFLRCASSQGTAAAFTLKRKSISSLIEWRLERGFPLNFLVGEKKSIMRINIFAEDLSDQLVVGIPKCEIVRTCNKCNICNKLTLFFLY